mmetsp:Transcript_2370/g.7844  ORF Transcript_2370/g.7844 Transcript_2370/m.7844 type:complete len:171 (+) Transcript_2370:2-514(+)
MLRALLPAARALGHPAARRCPPLRHQSNGSVDESLREALRRVTEQVRARDPGASVVSGPDAQLGGGGDGGGALDGVEGVQTPGPKFLLRFTCDHARCDQEADADRTSTKLISQQAYTEGIVLVKCHCDKLHLIADRLGWFGEEGDVEELLRAKGEHVVRRLEDTGLLDRE